MVVALHGCTPNASGYGTGAGWTELADRLRFSVVLPEQQRGNNFNRCFNWFERGDTTRGQGEAESIAQMVRTTIVDTGADPARVHVTGLSTGGAMTAVMLAAYPDMFAGGGVVAGYPHAVYAANGRPVVERYTITGMGQTQCGTAGAREHLRGVAHGRGLAPGGMTSAGEGRGCLSPAHPRPTRSASR